MALQFQRWDVDQLMDEMPVDQFEEWCDFFAVEPQGWQATQLAVQRLSFMLAQVQTRKRLKEKDFALRMVQTNTVEYRQHMAARAEAECIRAGILAKMESGDVH